MHSPTTDLRQLFKTQYEKLAGKVYFATSAEQAIAFVDEIVAKSHAAKAVIAPLPENLETKLRERFRSKHFPVIEIQPQAGAIPHQINEADLGVSAAEFAIAETGTIVEVTTDDAHRLTSSLPRVHIAFLHAAQIIHSIDEAGPRLRAIYQRHKKHCNITFISGPSRTADIEMKLFLGVHGPQESHVIVFDFLRET